MKQLSDAEILKEIERRIEEWRKIGGWHEANAGLNLVSGTIEDLRNDGHSPDWDGL